MCLFCCFGCSFFKGRKNERILDLQDYNAYEDRDYIDHLGSLADVYLNTPLVRQVKLNWTQNQYLRKMAEKILVNNEILLKKDNFPTFFIIKNKVPFHFSLPGNKIFFSLGLLKKYVKHEGILACIIAFELIKSQKNLYQKNIIIPKGFIQTEQILSLSRISLKDKIELDKWAIYLLRRAGYDAYVYLSWIQIQNRNTLDFSIHLGNIKNISREEFSIKNFIVSHGFSSEFLKMDENSSKDFYSFINGIRKITL